MHCHIFYSYNNISRKNCPIQIFAPKYVVEGSHFVFFWRILYLFAQLYIMWSYHSIERNIDIISVVESAHKLFRSFYNDCHVTRKRFSISYRFYRFNFTGWQLSVSQRYTFVTILMHEYFSTELRFRQMRSLFLIR